ncbi:MAG: ArsR/SmtB family transcription factor [Ignavibacteria bacterium]
MMEPLEKYEKIFKALSDKSRLRILKMLQRKSLCVCEITEILKLATSTVSKHLSILHEAGLIISDKDKKWVNYKINPEPEDDIVSAVLLFVHLQLENDEVIKKDKKALASIDRNIICCSK